MSSEFSLDIPYYANPNIVCSIKNADSMAILGVGTQLEVPLPLVQVVMAFADKKTARQAFQILDVDSDIDEFGRIVRHLCDCGLLIQDQYVDDGHSLQRVLSHRSFSDVAFLEKVGAWMRQGRAIVIPDALPADFAEEVHCDLSKSTHWSAAEGGHDFFHYRVGALSMLEHQTPALTECSRLFRSTATRRFVGELSGQDCAGEAHVAATWYRANEYALPHDDATGDGRRSVAYVWYLTKGWKQEWGGTLFWCPTGQYVSPGFNVLVMFNVMPSNVHLICPVAPSATAKRLTINGFWSHSGPHSPSIRVDPDAIVSTRAYGPPVPEGADRLPVLVL